MSEMANALGSGSEITLLGETYNVNSFGIDMWGRVKQYLQRKKRKEIMQIVTDIWDDLPKDIASERLDKATAEAQAYEASDEDALEFAESFEGVAYTTWLLIEDRYPGKISFDQVFRELWNLDTLDKAALAAIKEGRDEAAAIGTSGNADGLDTKAEKTSSGTSEKSPEENESNEQPVGTKSSGI